MSCFSWQGQTVFGFRQKAEGSAWVQASRAYITARQLEGFQSSLPAVKKHLQLVNYIQPVLDASALWWLLLRVLVPIWGREANSTGNLIHFPAVVVYIMSLCRYHLGLGRQRNNAADTSQLCRYWGGSTINSCYHKPHSAALALVLWLMCNQPQCCSQD